MSHALLLRLFLSPSFFTVHVALQYLRLYADNIGITYYLTSRLRQLDTQDLREVWGFICHLLVTRPSKSRALECFVVEICHKSTHIAMLTLWYMQAYLKDFSLPRHNPESFVICQRVLHECHEIIFGDLPAQPIAPYSILTLPSQLGPLQKRVKPHVQPVVVGIGMVWAGTPGMPKLTKIMGRVAIEQGRIDDQNEDIKSLENTDDSPVRTAPSTTSIVATGEDNQQEDSDKEDKASAKNPPDTAKTGTEAVVPVKISRRRRTMAAQTTPALPLHLKGIRRFRLSEDPFGQQDLPSPNTSSSPFQSTPSFSVTKRPQRTTGSNAVDILMQKYDLPAQVHLLRSHYCRSEIKFLIALESISNRLLVVPRLARVSALRAELTALNHLLPAEVCMPMWCSSSDSPGSSHDVRQPHHRIVRIPPGESVVLNSAERAPYLLLIEILHGDLDFDPAKRSNKEILKKIVLKENSHDGSKEDFAFPDSPFAAHQSVTNPESVSALEVSIGTDSAEVNDSRSGLGITSFLAVPVSPAMPVDEEEEVDLVEQIYGADNSLRADDVNLSDSIVLPPPPKNRELDMVTWSRSSSVPQTPSVDQGDSFRTHKSFNGLSLSIPMTRRRLSPPLEPDSSHLHPHSNGQPTPRVLSLDEYSDRMRTAAVMLAQLNANLVREPTTALLPPGTPVTGSESTFIAPLRWLPGTNWRISSPVVSATGAAPSGSSQEHPLPLPSASVSTRMRLQPSEAAAIRERIMGEMLALEEERMARMRENSTGEGVFTFGLGDGSIKTAEDEGIIRRELSKVDPSAVVFSESWAAKKSRIRQASPYGHLANWDCVSVIVKTGGDLRQEQLAVQLIQEFEKIWKEENCSCWVRYFRILILGNSSGLVETITDAVSIHSIKKSEYARRLAEGQLGHVTLFDHFKTTYGDPSSAKFARAQRNFAKSLAGYSLVTYFLQIKDRHNGNILLDRDGHLIHIDFGFMLSNSPGNIGFEAAPFKLPLEYIEVLGGIDSKPYAEFSRLFKEGFEAARKHCDRIITLVELMQKDSTLPCFVALGEQTAAQLRERFQQGLTHAFVEEHVQRLIDTSLGSSWTRLYDSYQYYSQSIL
ncbi:predicted protein [Sparassis crispa]|uniref:1-phosphatidylinositol 4-kinase n=1 Tax=Sparassis crispa TaxID=139825 RepID=A0A401GIJ9_9APHY|nr:predicted protein [Sparassis crispa]GBE81999.1 predicted protein [Sparassis crispa]